MGIKVPNFALKINKFGKKTTIKAKVRFYNIIFSECFKIQKVRFFNKSWFATAPPLAPIALEKGKNFKWLNVKFRYS